MQKSDVKKAYEKWQQAVKALRDPSLESRERERMKAEMDRAKGNFLGMLPAFLSFGETSFEDYQAQANKTAIYPSVGHNLMYPLLGLLSESGEVADKVKKMIRDGGGKMTDGIRAKIIDELGDVLWYVSQTARELGTSVSEVATRNMRKLSERAERGMLHGSGDER